MNTQSLLGIVRENGDLFISSTRAIRASGRGIEIDGETTFGDLANSMEELLFPLRSFSPSPLYFSHDSIPITSTKSEIIPLAAPRNRIHIPRDFRDCWQFECVE